MLICLYDRMLICLQNAYLSAFEFFVVPICSTQAYQKCLWSVVLFALIALSLLELCTSKPKSWETYKKK